MESEKNNQSSQSVPPPGRITEKRISSQGSGLSRAPSAVAPSAITPPPIKRIHLAAKPPGKTRKRIRMKRGESLIEIGADVTIIVLSISVTDLEILVEAPPSVYVSHAQKCEIVYAESALS